MADIATLGLKIETAQVKAGADSLDRLQQSADRAEKSAGNLEKSMDSAGASIVGKLAAIASAAGGLYVMQRAFQAGIQAADEFRLATIGVAATITDMAKNQGAGQMNYNRALAYSKDMYQELELAAARYFASGQEMTQAWNILAQKGVVLRKDEIDSLGVIVDRIKLSTQGQTSSIQIAQEMRAMLTGQARTTDQIGMLLKDRIPNLEAEITKHRQIGDLVKWLGDQFKGLKYASIDIQDTLESQKSTLSTLLTQVGRGGLAGAYNDIVDILKQANDYLTTHKNEISGGIASGWQAVKELAGGVSGFVQEIAKIAKAGIVVPITFSIGRMSKFLSSGGQVEGGEYQAGGQDAGLGIPGVAARRVNIPPQSDFGFGALNQNVPELGVDAKMRQNLELAKQAAQYKKETFELYAKGLGAPEVSLPGDTKKGGGGAGVEAAERQLENFINRLKTETAKAAGESFGALNEWHNKEALALSRLEEKTGSSLEARGALESAYYSMRKALIDKFSESELKRFDESAKKQEALWLSSLDLQKGLYDQLSQAFPEEVGFKKKALDLDIEINRATQDRKLMELEKAGWISKNQAEEIRGMEARLNEGKQYNLERENWKTGGIAGGINLFALELRQESATSLAFGIRDGLKGAKNYADSAITDLIMSPFTKKKMDFKKIGLDIATSLTSGMVKMGTTGIFSFFTGGAMRMVSTWQTAQETMTAASLAGDAARIGSMASGLSQGTSLLTMAAKANILVEAGQAGAAGFKSVMEAVPFPFNIILAPITAAAAFAATMAFGSGFGGGGVNSSAGGPLSPGLQPSISHGGSIVAHRGWLVAHDGLNLASDERRIIAQVGEPIINRNAWRQIENIYGSGAFEMFNSGRVPAVPVPVSASAHEIGQGVVNHNTVSITIHAPGADKSLDWNRIVKREILPVISNELNRGKRLNGY